MEIVASFGSSVSSISYQPPNRFFRCGATRPEFLCFGSETIISTPWVQQKQFISRVKIGYRKVNFVMRKGTSVRASMRSSDSGGVVAPVAPLQLESPVGQFLSQILISHPHLVPAAVEQQLEQLQTEREADKEKEQPSASGTDLVLYRRISEVKANERRKALEEILYALVVQKFMDANVSLVPTTVPSSRDKSGRVDTWPTKEGNVESLHSPEAYEMIQNHLSLILGNLSDLTSVAQISKLRVGQVYAASVMFGYFLKRVDQRFQLEKTMKNLPLGIDNEDIKIQLERSPSSESSSETFQNATPHPEVSPSAAGGGGFSSRDFSEAIKASRLRTYLMSFDGETLKRYATVRSKEAMSIVEKHTEALFGRPEIVITPEGTVDTSKTERMNISYGGLRRLVLEAVTFGSFLWEIESYVDSRYHFVAK